MEIPRKQRWKINDNMMCHIEKQRKHTIKHQVYIFLASFDHNSDQVSNCVLATSPLLSLEQALVFIMKDRVKSPWE